MGTMRSRSNRAAILPLIAFAVVIFLAGALVHAKPLITEGETDPVEQDLFPPLVEALGGGMKTPGSAIGPDASLADVMDAPQLQAAIRKHDLRLMCGPMLGVVTESSARFWARTWGEAEMQVIVGTDAKLEGAIKSKPVKTRKDNDFTAVAEIAGLKPFTTYTYDVLVNGQTALKGERPTFRTFPAKSQKVKFDVGFGGGAQYIPANEGVWATIAAGRPLAFLFLGDNVYIDLPERRDVQRVYYYQRQLRSEYRRMCASTAIYAVWDDHDFGANDCSGGLDPFRPAWKLPVWKVFCQNWNNPYYGGGEKQPGCWFDFSIGDVDFFMTDGRYYRDFKSGTMLGPAQKAWLLERLKASKATFKVIASGTLWTDQADKSGADSWAGVKAERDEIFSLIAREKLRGVILISADRHRTEMWKIERPNGYTLYEFESSKLTNDHTHPTRKEALWSYNKGNFFGVLSFDLTPADPEVTYKAVSSSNEVLHELRLKRSQLEDK
ncbi:MAG: alkaline phosphatase D family protein [Candidatus Sumerlaeota bacterium]|nr:alkaline phosphatase D family protein [Candidatus Sumerlaeota bacterium]